MNKLKSFGLLFFAILFFFILSSCAKHVVDAKRSNKASTTSYKVNGITYYPVKYKKYKEVGIASWYGGNNQKRLTASGEVFDKNKLTGAHKFLPIPSLVKVTNLENGKSIKVRVNDRGPFLDERIIDLSEKSAKLLGFQKNGLAKVKIELISY